MNIKPLQANLFLGVFLLISSASHATTVMSSNEAFEAAKTMESAKDQCEAAFDVYLNANHDRATGERMFTEWRYWGDEKKGWLGAELVVDGQNTHRLGVCPIEADSEDFHPDPAKDVFVFFS